MIASPETTIGEIAARFPQTHRVFHRLRIEFCCDGHRPLADVCRERDLSFDELAASLIAAVASPLPVRHDWAVRPLAELTAHIVEGFHEPLRQELPRLRRMAAKVQHHSEPSQYVLAVVLYEVERFSVELGPHMAATEGELYPLIGRLEAGSPREGDGAHFDQLRAALESDHAGAGQALRILRKVTGRYEPPASACATLRDLYRGLKDLEQLTQLHVHLENNALFPRAAALVRAAGL